MSETHEYIDIDRNEWSNSSGYTGTAVYQLIESVKKVLKLSHSR